MLYAFSASLNFYHATAAVDGADSVSEIYSRLILAQGFLAGDGDSK